MVLFTLRLTGLEPAYLDPSGEAFARSNRIARPGLWLTGEVVREEVPNWDFANHVDDPIRGNTIMLETPTWYGIPHSVTIGVVGGPHPVGGGFTELLIPFTTSTTLANC